MNKTEELKGQIARKMYDCSVERCEAANLPYTDFSKGTRYNYFNDAGEILKLCKESGLVWNVEDKDGFWREEGIDV